MKTDFKSSARRWCFAIGFLSVVIIHASAAEVASEIKPAIAPPAGWVKPQFFDRRTLVSRPEGAVDQHWLLLERQVEAAANETFFHGARQILTVAGVQNGANLKIDFNPSYQALTLHWVRLWRGTNRLDRLAPGKIRVVRQERDLDQEQILNGEQTAMLVMEDVRVGDIVDYAYSVKGANPVFAGKFSTSLSLQLEQPVEQLFTRVLLPAQRRFFPKAHGSVMEPRITNRSNVVECVWDLRQVPGVRTEDALPVWFDPEPWVQLSEFKNWAEVNQWALMLFENQSALSVELTQKITEWKHLPDREQQVLTALRFVQDEIRYFGIEIGVSSQKPCVPATVFSRRFGDCKDKSLLFVTLLRGLGIEAYPVLVNTQSRHTIDDWLPAANIFDHCIAVVRLEGQTWWLDPTAGYQRGPLAAHYLPNYGRGLVISAQTTGLTPIPQTTGMPLTTTTEFFDLGKKSGTTDLKVVTVAEGRDAESLRATFAETKHGDIEKAYTHFYAGSYPGTQMSAPLEVQDDQAQNRFQITEYYTIDQVWIKSDSDSKYRCDFYPVSLSSLIKKPVDTRRKFPLGVAFPQHQILRTEITVPVSFTYDRENKTVNDPAFAFVKQSRRTGRKLVLEYGYQTLADFIPANRTEEYLQNLDKVSKSFGDGFVWR